MNREKNYFDSAAAGWNGDPARRERAASIVAAIKARLPLKADMAALDYGCGPGTLALLLAPELRRVTAADSSDGMLEALRAEAAKAGLANIEPLKLDLERGPAPAGGYDLVVSSMAMHHVGDVPRVLAAFYGLLKPGGRVFVADLDAEPGTFHSGPVAATVRHNGFDRAVFLGMLEGAGFAGASAVTVHAISKPAAGGALRDYPVFLACAERRA